MRTPQRIVEVEVLLCVSSLVEKLADLDPQMSEDIMDAVSEAEAFARDDDDDDADDDDDYTVDVLEYWAVSNWLGNRLRELGEVVIDYDYMATPIWGRQTSGQVIYDDAVIGQLCKQLEEN